MASATPDLRLPSQPQGITALWPVPNYTAWWQRHMCVNNLPKVVTWQCPGAESNLHPWVTSGLQVRHVTVRLPSHTVAVFILTMTTTRQLELLLLLLALKHKVHYYSLPASTMAALLLGQTDSTLSTLDVVQRSFSYVVVLMIRTNSRGPPLAIIINYTTRQKQVNTYVT